MIYYILLNKSIDTSIVISQDERCYTNTFINDVINIYRLLVSYYESINVTHLTTLKIFKKLISLIKINYDKRLEELDLPSKFLDPLTFCDIKEPLFLPNSDIIIDKKTIFKHLLSHNNDPFNRQYLTMDILIDYNNKTDVKDKINAFLNEKKEWISTNIKR